MTPLIDMVFILLIFFLVTTTFVAETGLSINRPRSSSAGSLPRESVSIVIGADGRITLGGREAGLYSIRPYLERQLRSRPELAAVIVADRAVSVDRIVRVMDEIRAAGVADMALAAEAEE
jgi:biopolymer transport protein ExbD